MMHNGRIVCGFCEYGCGTLQYVLFKADKKILLFT